MRQQTKAESVCISLVALISCLTLGNELSRWASPLCLALQLGHHLYTQLFLCIMLHTMTLQSPKACLPAVTHLEVAGCCASWLDLLLLLQYQLMMGNFGMTQEQVSKSVGKSRPYIANSMRLLKLPQYIRDSISEGKLTAGHGRTLITIPDEKKQEEIWEKIIDEGLSVRETEKLAASEGKTKKRTPLKKKKSPDVLKVEEELKTALGTKISISGTQNKGKIEIEFYSKDDLERLIELLKSLG